MQKVRFLYFEHRICSLKVEILYFSSFYDNFFFVKLYFRGVKFFKSFYHFKCIAYCRGFNCRMHSQLRKSDINTGKGNLCIVLPMGISRASVWHRADMVMPSILRTIMVIPPYTDICNVSFPKWLPLCANINISTRLLPLIQC